MAETREGSLDAPFRHPLDWRDESFYDLKLVEDELERVFDICHGCRRCFNLCDSFPRLFDMIDEGPTGEVDGVPRENYAKVTEACTLCDMCFMTKCPYVPPHRFNVDFPHVLLRHRAAMRKRDGGEFVREQLGETDRNGKLAKPVAGVVNWATKRENKPVRAAMDATLKIDKDAILPKYVSRTAKDRLKALKLVPDPSGPAFGQRKVALYTTCFSEYNAPETAEAAAAVLSRQGIEVRHAYPVCCGMPELEAGNIAEVAERARQACAALLPLVDQGYDVVTLTASCGLMLKFEWPLILPENEDVKRLAAATRDISQYVVELSKQYGLAPFAAEIDGAVSLQHACHARAQNMGAVSAQMLRLIPGMKVDLIERCSGHGGTFGVMKGTHEIALKVGKPAARQIAGKDNAVLCSDCPLACKHLGQMVSAELKDGAREPAQSHPIQIVAQAYGY